MELGNSNSGNDDNPHKNFTYFLSPAATPELNTPSEKGVYSELSQSEITAPGGYNLTSEQLDAAQWELLDKRGNPLQNSKPPTEETYSETKPQAWEGWGSRPTRHNYNVVNEAPERWTYTERRERAVQRIQAVKAEALCEESRTSAPRKDLDPLWELPSFVVPHDGTQSEVNPAEAAVVGEGFTALVDDMLFSFAGQVEHYAGTTAGDARDYVSLKIPVEGKGYYSVVTSVRNQTPAPDAYFPPSEQIIRTLSVQEIAGVYGRRFMSYYQYADGVVRRYDVDDMYTKIHTEREQGTAPPEITTDMSPDEVHNAIVVQHEHMLGEIENGRLERAMGYQNQPIGTAELVGLSAFVQHPDIQAA
jgi:hypothetical protein